MDVKSKLERKISLSVLKMSNEFAFIHSVHRVVKQRWRSGGEGKSYVYRFDVNSDNNCFSTLNRVDPMYREPIHMVKMQHWMIIFVNLPSVPG